MEQGKKYEGISKSMIMISVNVLKYFFFGLINYYFKDKQKYEIDTNLIVERIEEETEKIRESLTV